MSTWGRQRCGPRPCVDPPTLAHQTHGGRRDAAYGSRSARDRHALGDEEPDCDPLTSPAQRYRIATGTDVSVVATTLSRWTKSKASSAHVRAPSLRLAGASVSRSPSR